MIRNVTWSSNTTLRLKRVSSCNFGTSHNRNWMKRFLKTYNIGMTTWASWIDSNIDVSKIKVFFQGVSTSHLDGSKWGEANGTCRGQTSPVEGPVYPVGLNPGEEVFKDVISKMKHPIYLLDIALLT